jgi:hypothetical protein
MSLICGSCGYDNDPTRVYCHNCGIRLDREGAVAPPPTGFTAAAEFKRPPRRAGLPWGAYVKAVARLVILVALVGFIVLALLRPDDVPPPVTPDPELSDRLASLVADSASSSGARAFSIPAADASVWLATNISLHAPEGFALLRPERAYLVPGDGFVRVGIVAMLPMNYPLYFEGNFVPVRGADGYTLEARRLSIGRLALPRVLDLLVRRHFAGLGEAVELPLAALARCDQIAVTPESINLRWSPSQP